MAEILKAHLASDEHSEQKPNRRQRRAVTTEAMIGRAIRGALSAGMTIRSVRLEPDGSLVLSSEESPNSMWVAEEEDGYL